MNNKQIETILARLSPADSQRSSISSHSCLEEDIRFGNRRKREFWFAVPRQRVDTIYHFLLHWSPEKYGQEEASTADETNVPSTGGLLEHFTSMETLDSQPHGTTDSFATGQKGGEGQKTRSRAIIGSGKGFVVLDSDVDESLTGGLTGLEGCRGDGVEK